MKEKIVDSRSPRPAVYYCARELHFFILRALSGLRDRSAMLARRAAERAALAVELGTADDCPRRNLPQALTAIRTSMFHCDTLCEQGSIDPQTHDYLRRSVDRIIAGLEQLRGAPSDEWLGLPLAPLETEPSKLTERSEPAQPTRFQTIVDRVAQAVRSILPSRAPSAENGQLSQSRKGSGRAGSG
jgi:hypothetical protein